MTPLEFNSSATLQNIGIITGLCELGHCVDTLTTYPLQGAKLYDASVVDIKCIVNNVFYIPNSFYYTKLMAKKTNPQDARNVVKILDIKRSVRNFIRSVFNFLAIFDAQKYNISGINKCKINFYKYDIIISASDPKSSHLLARKIFHDNPKLKAKWIQYWGDPMYIDITRKKDWKDIIVKRCEANLLRNADKIVYPSPFTLAEQKKLYPSSASKMLFANQATLHQASYSDMQSNSSNVNICYVGAYNSNVRNIMPLYNFFMTTPNTNLQLIIGGSSDIKLNNSKNIRVIGQLTYEESTMIESSSDILVCVCNKRGTQIPGKIYYLAGYNKPIIVIVDGEYSEQLKQYFAKYQRYIICNNNELSIKEALDKAVKELDENRHYKLTYGLTCKCLAQTIIGTDKQL